MKLSIVLSTQPASFSALAYQGQLLENIAKIAALGYDGVELAVRDPAMFDVDQVAEAVAANKLTVPAIGTGQAFGEEGLSFTHDDEGIRRKAVTRIKSQIELAAKFAAVVIIGLIRGKASQAANRKNAFDWLASALSDCADHAKRFGVRLAIEPINRYETDLVNTATDGLDLIESIGAENLGLLLDTFHMNIEEPSMFDSIRRAGSRIFHFHVADSNRWYPGAGHVDFRKTIQVLMEANYTGFVSAEILPLPDPDTCARKTIDTMKPLLKGALS